MDKHWIGEADTNPKNAENWIPKGAPKANDVAKFYKEGSGGTAAQKKSKEKNKMRKMKRDSRRKNR